MGQEEDDYEDRDVPVPAIVSPADLIRQFAKIIGITVFCISVSLGLLLLGHSLLSLLLR